MPRGWIVNGETLVQVKGGAQFGPDEPITVLTELGLAAEPILITPTFYHRDILVDDFGPNVPAEVMWNICEVNIRMALIHYDIDILDICMAESMGGAPDDAPGFVFPDGVPLSPAGTLQPAGALMGNGLPLFAIGNHYISLNLSSPVLNLPWHFPSAYLANTPVTIPLGTHAEVVICNWRAIPYRPLFTSGGNTLMPTSLEILSSGAILFNHILDSG